LVRLTYGELARVVQTRIGSKPCRVLYVGSGLGHIALELARAGHDVTAVDPDEESIVLARRAAGRDPLKDQRGNLTYEVGQFPDGQWADGSFDRVLFCRVLHHIADPTLAATRAAQLLARGGRVACVDFAYDRLGPAGARWRAQTRMDLARSGWWPEPVTASLAAEQAEEESRWWTEHEQERLNTFRGMLHPLRDLFRVPRPAWHPYLFWDMAAEMTVPADRQGTVAARLHDQELSMLRQGRLRGVLFSFSGAKQN
jgi:ubiquinone/menaquinone biosynthesis C-methylase UbiE